MSANITPNALKIAQLALAASFGALLALFAADALKDHALMVVGIISGLLATIALVLFVVGFRQRAALRHEAQIQAEDRHELLQSMERELEKHRKLEVELSEAKRAIESAMMAKGEFLATMSHEIRTPLNGILPMLDLLLNARLAPEHQDLVRTAHGSARQMLRIVDDILDYSKLEANKVELETTAFNLREVVESVMHLMQKPAENKGLLLNLNLEPSVRLAVRGDPTRLRQVLTNLLSNAVKFTQRGKIVVNVRRLGETRLQHRLRFEVVDSGIGIPTEKQSQLFNPFTQADTSTTRLYGGTGLGLVICRRITELMGGTIGVTSSQGRGSTFWFEIPLLKAVGDLPAGKKELDGARLLLISADTVFCERFQYATANWGVRCLQVANIAEALHTMRSATARPNDGFDMVVADLDGGVSLPPLLRSLSRSAELLDTRILALFGSNGEPRDIVWKGPMSSVPRSLAANELRKVALELLAQLPESDEEEGESRSGESATAISALDGTPLSGLGRRARVLLVEDNPVNLMVAQKLIGLMGLHVDSAGDGVRALERMTVGGLDLVLMDCQMPVKDGYTATTEWRNYEAERGLPRLPIIAMTANAMAGDRQKCIEAGMDDYVAKPIDRLQLEAVMTKWLQRADMKRIVMASRAMAKNVFPPDKDAASEAQLAEVPPPTVDDAPVPDVHANNSNSFSNFLQTKASIASRFKQEPTPDISPSPQVIDGGVLNELKEVMGSDYLKLIRVFLEDAPIHIARLEEAVSSNQHSGLIAPAHTLKSASANLGAIALSEAAAKLEIGAKQGMLSRPAVAVAVIDAEFRRARMLLEKLLNEPG